MPADVTSQSRNCFKTIEAALKEGGFEMADIVRVTYYLTDAKDADAHFAVCGEVLGEIRPAATLLVVSGAVQARDEGRDRSDRETSHLKPASRACQLVARPNTTSSRWLTLPALHLGSKHYDEPA